MADIAETRIQLVQDLHFVAHTRAGHEIHLDSRLDADDSSTGTSPMELQLVTLAGCTAMDVISILRKMREDVAAYDLRISGERATAHPRVYTSILLTHSLRGASLAERNVRRAVELSMTRYCPVFAMLHPTVPIRECYEITDDANATVTGEMVIPVAAVD